MKLTMIILFSATMLVSAGTYSQNTRLTLDFSDISYGELFSKIEAQSEFSFAYNGSNFDPNQKVRVNITNGTMDEILKEILPGNVSYEIINKYVIIRNADGASSSLLQQPLTVSGRVLDSSGSPLPGVTVVVKGSTKGTITDAQGNYSLADVPGDATLVFSFVGMKTQEIPVGGKSTINVTLAESTIGIEEVVAIGYGTMKKIELTSAVSSVKAEDFRKGSITDAAQLIKGKVAGLTIINPDADPTSTSQILLRGVTTLRSGSQPLIVIDGIPGNLTDVAPDDIESIDILKDGSAAAIYGTRGTNGVILITTKKVKGETPATLEYNGYVTTQSISKRLEFLNASEYRELVAQGKNGAIDRGSSTDWQDEIFQTPVSQTHNISLKGGNANTNYIMNLNYKALEGLILRSDNNIINVRIEANHTMFNGKLKINGNIMGYDQKYNSLNFDGAYSSALLYNPTDAVKDEDGNWTQHTNINIASNPVALLYEADGITETTNFKPFGTITLLPFNGLSIKALGSHEVNNSVYGYAESFDHINSSSYGRKGYAARNATKSVNDLLEITANYIQSFGKHGINILGGYSYQENIYQRFEASNYNFASDQYSYNNLGNGTALSNGLAGMSSTKSSNKLVSYFSRANYNYNDRYMLTASIRYEGSTRFGKDHKWGAFPSVSAGWNIINESFMEGFKSTFSSLKLRGGFGITGTVPNDNYASLDRLTTGNRGLYNGEWISTFYPSTNANPDLRWEKKEETNIGIDVGILDNRISATIDLYKRTTKDMLWQYSVPKPPYLYTTILANAGTMENKGLELQLNAIPVQNSMMTWNTSVNYSTNKNKVVSLSSDDFVLETGYFYTGSAGQDIWDIPTHIVREGERIGDFYGWKSVDIDDNGYWIIEGKDGTPKPIADAVQDDKQVLGNGLPKHYLSWNNTITFKRFDLNISMRGAFGFQIFNMNRELSSVPIALSRGNVMKGAYDNIYGKRPLADNQSHVYVSYFIEDGDYWKIDNITLGYTLDLKRGPFKYFRVYASGKDLFTFTGYSGLDPEVSYFNYDSRLNRDGGALLPGTDFEGRYPTTRSYTLGISVKF